MGFYLIQGGKSSYISEYYLKYSLLHSDKISNEIVAVKSNSEEVILKKLNIEIPEVHINDIIKKFQNHLKINNIDDYSAILSFNRAHLLAIFYLLNENKITENEFRKLLFSSSFKTRNDLILSYLAGDTEENVDIFKPLQNYLYKLYNYDNPRELKLLKKTIKQLKDELFNEKSVFTVQKLNTGNVFYALKKGDKETEQLFKFCKGKWDLSGCTLPEDNDAIGLLHGGNYNVEQIAKNRETSWWATFGYVAVLYTAIAVILSLASVFGFGIGIILKMIMATLAGPVIADFDQARPVFGLSSYIFDNELFEKYLADSKYIRLDRVENDLICKHLFKAASFDFENRLNFGTTKYSIKDISDDVSQVYANNWFWESDSLFGVKNRKTIKANEFDWYNELYKIISNEENPGIFSDDLVTEDDPEKEYTKNRSTFIGPHFPDTINGEEETPANIMTSDRQLLTSKIGLGSLIKGNPASDTDPDNNRTLNNDYLISAIIANVDIDNYFAMLSSLITEFPSDIPFYITKNTPKNLDFILSNDVLIGDMEDVKYNEGDENKEITEHGARVINFGTVGMATVVSGIIQKLKEENNEYVLGIHEYSDLLKEDRRNKAFDHLISFISNDKNLQSFKTSLSESNQNLFPLARCIIYRYLLWLKNDDLDENSIDYTTIVPEWYYKYYKISYYFRHAYLNFVDIKHQITQNSRYKRLFDDPCGDRAALNALFLYCNKYKDSMAVNTFAPAFAQAIGTISNMMTNTYRAPFKEE